MSYYVEPKTGDVVINGWEKGISDSPHSGAQPLLGQAGLSGLGDMRNMNIISVPGEASVNFSTTQISPPVITGAISSADAGTFYLTYTGASALENNMAITFSAQSGLNVTNGTTYWVINKGGAGAGTFQIVTDYAQTTVRHVTNGTASFSVTQVTSNPMYFTSGSTLGLSSNTSPLYYMIEGNGKVWSTYFTTASSYWTFTGNTGGNGTQNGNGLIYYQASDSTAFVFAFRNSAIDYFSIATATWTYGWNPNDASTGNAAGYLKTISATNPHEAMVATDNRVYYCDANFIGSFYQTAVATAFVPTNLGTYTPNQTAVIPFNDICQCLTQLGTNLLIGGQKNIVYQWDRSSSSNSYPMLIPEYNTVKLITVNTNTFIFSGNRGRIYYTNGTNAQLYKKVPDFISQTIEPYFTWGGVASNKNQLYFSVLCTNNSGTTINQYGGVWGIDIDTKSIRLTNKLSYGTYAGYSTAIIPNFSATAAGTGLIIGWNSGVSTFGIDTTSSNPYSNAEATVDSDLIPLGTFLKPTTNGRVEFKLSVPIVSGESIKLQYRQRFSDSYTDIDSNIIFNFTNINTVWNGYAGVYQNVPFQNSQWIQIRAVSTSTGAINSPSYVRLTEIRLGN